MSRSALSLAVITLLCAVCAQAGPWRMTSDAVRQERREQEQRKQEAAEQRRRVSPREPLGLPSPNTVLGRVARVNKQEGFVVVWLESRYLNLNYRELVTRDAAMRITSRLSAGNARNDRAAGLVIVEGEPRIGDELVSMGGRIFIPEAEAAAPAAATTTAAEQTQPANAATDAQPGVSAEAQANARSANAQAANAAQTPATTGTAGIILLPTPAQAAAAPARAVTQTPPAPAAKSRQTAAQPVQLATPLPAGAPVPTLSPRTITVIVEGEEL